VVIGVAVDDWQGGVRDMSIKFINAAGNTLIAACTLAVSVPASSQAPTAQSPSTETITQALGITRSSEPSTRNDSAGQAEAEMLAFRALISAGRQLDLRLADGTTPQFIVPMVGEASAEVAVFRYVSGTIESLEAAVPALHDRCNRLATQVEEEDRADAEQSLSDTGGAQRSLASLPEFRIFRSVLDLLATSRDTRGVAIQLPPSSIINAIVASRPTVNQPTWIVASDSAQITPLESRANEVRRILVRAAAIRVGEGRCDEMEETAPRFTALAATFDQLTAATATQAAPIVRAATIARTVERGHFALVITPGPVGGSRVTVSNALTIFGAENLYVGALLGLSYRLVDMRTGVVHRAGQVTCIMPTVGFQRIHQQHAVAPDCRAS
jgi:hypothetical protein